VSIADRTVAILGASGMLGQALCLEAARRGCRVARLARAGVEHAVDATDSRSLGVILDSVRPAVIVNSAAMTSLEASEREPGNAYAINARVAAVLANYCSQHEIKLVQVSTDHYFTGDADRLHDEDASVSLLNEYARTKYAGEVFAGTCSSTLTLRTNLVGFRGWSGRPTFAEWAIAALQGSAPFTLFSDFYTSSLDVGSFCRALFDLVDRDVRGVLNVAAREAVSKAQFVSRLAQRMRLSVAHCRIGSVRELAGVVRAESLGLDVRRAESLLGYRLPDTQAVLEALVRTYEVTSHAIR